MLRLAGQECGAYDFEANGAAMSQQHEGEPGGAPSRAFDNPRDAKAQAKAEKAYRKAQRPWYKKKRFILPLALIALIIIISIANAGGDDTASTEPDSGSSAPSAEESAPAFPGAQEGDVIGEPGETLDLGDAQVTATPVAAGDDTFGATICSTVTLNNSSDEAIDFNALDWMLQNPGGTIMNIGFGGSENALSAGQIAPGGTATGDVCFDGEPAPGQYVLFYEPVFSFFSDRAAWVNTL